MFNNQYIDDREDKIIIFGEKLWYLLKSTNLLMQNKQRRDENIRGKETYYIVDTRVGNSYYTWSVVFFRALRLPPPLKLVAMI
jgi:hypothetical protein